MCRVHHVKRGAGWSTSWNQDYREKHHNLRYADDTTLMAESKEELESLLMKVIRGEWKSWLNIQKTKIMSSSLITSWQIDGKTMTDLIFLGSKITADGDCSHGIKRCLLLGRKAMTNLDGILKSRDITLPTKVQVSSLVVSDSLWSHWLQHTRPPCPSPTPRVYSTHVHWVGDAILPSHPLSSLSSAFSLSQHQGLFQWVSSLHHVLPVHVICIMYM